MSLGQCWRPFGSAAVKQNASLCSRPPANLPHIAAAWLPPIIPRVQPPEFRGFITSHGLQHEDIGISLAHAFAASPQASKAGLEASIVGSL